MKLKSCCNSSNAVTGAISNSSINKGDLVYDTGPQIGRRREEPTRRCGRRPPQTSRTLPSCRRPGQAIALGAHVVLKCGVVDEVGSLCSVGILGVQRGEVEQETVVLVCLALGRNRDVAGVANQQVTKPAVAAGGTEGLSC